MRHDKILYNRILNKITKTVSLGRSTFSTWEEYNKAFQKLVDQKIIDNFELVKDIYYGYIVKAHVKCQFPKESGGKMVKVEIYG